MTSHPEWLPDLIKLSDFHGDFGTYLEAIYQAFKEDFVTSSPSFRGCRFGMKRHPMEQGKEATFWHLTTTGDNEFTREHDFRRCERIRWPRAIIERAEETPEIKIWEEKSAKDTRVLLWFESLDYLVVLSKRSGYYLLWTAYPIERTHTRQKLKSRFEKSLKNS